MQPVYPQKGSAGSSVGLAAADEPSRFGAEDDLGRRVDVTEVRADAGRADDVVQAELAHQRIHLHEQRQRLADASRRACAVVDTFSDVDTQTHPHSCLCPGIASCMTQI